MKNNISNDMLQVMQEIRDTIEQVREIVKAKVVNYQYHKILQSDVETIYAIFAKIKYAFDKLNIENDAVEKMYIKTAELLSDYDICKVSGFFEEEILQLLDSAIEELDKYCRFQNGNYKRDIRVKYVDFYKEFKPEEHWLYKLLAKKYNVIFSDTPDYLFFSCFGNGYLKYNCVRIFISNEAVYPNLNLYDYAVTYSDFKITDRLLPNRDAFEDLKCLRLAENRQEAEELLASKEEFCNYVYSNGRGDPFREELFRAVNKYKKVLAGGTFLNNIGYTVDDLESFQKKFKFSIACENSWYKGYTTEKLINAFNAGTIPIYWGNPDISDIINTRAIINCHDYPDMESLIEEIKRLDNDDEAYLQKLMEPILVDEDMTEKYLREREEFIYHIIDQPYAKAFRRNRGLRGQWYNDWFCNALGYENEWFSPEKEYFNTYQIEMAIDGPLVSILIPVYNRKEIVKQAINSALAQEYKNIEIIIVDNCSTDGTYEELQKCYGDDGRIKLYQNDTNIGPVNNWRVCLEKATGKYIKILWSDDLTETCFVGCGVKAMEEDATIGMVFSTCVVFKGNDLSRGSLLYNTVGSTGRYERDVFYKGMFQDEIGLPVSPGAALFRREDVNILKSIPNGLGLNCNANGAGIDLLILLQALDKHENFYYINEPMNFFRWHEGSITATNNLVREYNLAKLYFCQNFESASRYLQNMKMRILRDERITTAEAGAEIWRKYGIGEEWEQYENSTGRGGRLSGEQAPAENGK